MSKPRQYNCAHTEYKKRNDRHTYTNVGGVEGAAQVLPRLSRLFGQNLGENTCVARRVGSGREQCERAATKPHELHEGPARDRGAGASDQRGRAGAAGERVFECAHTHAQAAYAGDKAHEIRTREAEVVNSWHQLHALCEARRIRLSDTTDLFKFKNMVRDLLLWMEEVRREMNTQERPKSVYYSLLAQQYCFKYTE